MSEVVKIVQLLKSEAIEKQIAAAIVLGELKAKGPGVVEGLGEVLASGVPLLQVHALDALARVGAKKALPAIFPLLATGADDVRRAATRCIERVHLEQRHAAGEHFAQALDDAGALGFQLSEDDRRRDLLLDGLALEELDDLDDFAHFHPPNRPPLFPPRGSWIKL